MHGTAYSSHEHLRIILPGTGDALGNSEFPASKRGNVREDIRTRVEALLFDCIRPVGHPDQPWWGKHFYTVSVWENANRGEYTISVQKREND